MGSLFQRKLGGSTSPVWQMRYRVRDGRASKWGAIKYESTHTVNRREAESLLRERELLEERKRVGVELAIEAVSLGKAISEFLDSTQVFDREVPERNRRTVHPVLGIVVKGTSWWTRTVELAGEVLRRFGADTLLSTIGASRVSAFDRWLDASGGAEGRGVGASTRRKVLTWSRRFGRWAIERGYLAEDPFVGFGMPKEIVKKRDRILDASEVAAFWSEYEALPREARVRVGLVLFTGARAGETDTITVADISASRLTVRRRLWKKSRGDSPTEAIVKVPAELVAVLSEHIAANALSPNDRLLPIRCQAGGKFLRRWATSMRGLRRTVLTRLQDAGVSLRVIQEAAGHAKLDTTQRYLGIGASAVSDALGALDWAKAGATESATKRAHVGTTLRELARHEGELD